MMEAALSTFSSNEAAVASVAWTAGPEARTAEIARAQTRLFAVICALNKQSISHYCLLMASETGRSSLPSTVSVLFAMPCADQRTRLGVLPMAASRSWTSAQVEHRRRARFKIRYIDDS